MLTLIDLAELVWRCVHGGAVGREELAGEGLASQTHKLGIQSCTTYPNESDKIWYANHMMISRELRS
jgi:hypothetical protein